MRTIEKCIIEVEGWPNYRDEIRFYVASNGEFMFGPFKTEAEAIECKESVFKKTL